MQKKTTPIRSIRSKCIDCSGNMLAEVRLCPVTECPLYQYRLGKNPARARRKLDGPFFVEKSRVETVKNNQTEVLNG